MKRALTQGHTHGGEMSTELRLLGAVQILDDGLPVAIDGRKPRQLLAALMLNANRLVSIDRLIEAVWGDDPPRSAIENLRTYATALRKGLTSTGDQVRLTTSRAGFLLRTDGAMLDLEGFRTAAAAARDAADPAAAARAILEDVGTALR